MYELVPALAQQMAEVISSAPAKLQLANVAIQSLLVLVWASRKTMSGHEDLSHRKAKHTASGESVRSHSFAF